MSDNAKVNIEEKVEDGLKLTTLESWMSGIGSDEGESPDWLQPLSEMVEKETGRKLFKSGREGSNGEATDGYYTLNMRGLAKVGLGLDSTKETDESTRKHKIAETNYDDFEFNIEFGRGGSQTMGDAALSKTQILTGGGGADSLLGGTGDDIIAGNRGDDTVRAGDGQDFVKGGSGSDSIDGDGGSDYLVGDFSDSARHEDRAADGWNDTINGGDGNDFVLGNQGDDELNGDAGNDHVSGGTGNDVMSGGSGNDTMLGGEGNDTAVFSGSVLDYNFQTYQHMRVTDTAENRDGVDMVSYDTENYEFEEGRFKVIRGHNAGDNKTADAGVNTLLIGMHGNDSLTGNTGNDVLIGDNGLNFTYQGGDDTLSGRDGDDTIIAGAGDDKLFGGNGNDALFGGEDKDFLSTGTGVNLADGGIGIVNQNDPANNSTDNDHLNTNGSNGSQGVTVNGVNVWSNLGQALGNSGIEIEQSGTQAAYVISGGGGPNANLGLQGDNSAPVGSENAIYDADTLMGLYEEFVANAGAAGIQNATLAVNVEQIKGTQYNDTFLGLGASDNFWGGAGNDEMQGNGGNDHLNGEAGNDNIMGGSGNDELLGGSGNDSMDGGADNDKLFGHTGNDTMDGGAGDDLFWITNGFDMDNVDGGADTDTLSLGAVSDDVTVAGTNLFGTKLMQASANGGADSASFENVEILKTGGGNDTFSGGYAHRDLTSIDMGEGNDVFSLATHADDALDINAGRGNDIVHVGGSINSGGTGLIDGLIRGGEGEDTLALHHLERDDYGTGFELTFTGDGRGTIGYRDGEADVTRFDGFEEFTFGNFKNAPANNDYVDATATTAGLSLDTNYGDDTILGGSGDDTFTGGTGDDVIDGGAGNDILIGNGGADAFVFDADSGDDVIVDFEAGVDTIDITAWWATQRDIDLSVVDGDTILGFNGQSITLEGVDLLDGYASPSQFVDDNIFM